MRGGRDAAAPELDSQCQGLQVGPRLQFLTRRCLQRPQILHLRRAQALRAVPRSGCYARQAPKFSMTFWPTNCQTKSVLVIQPYIQPQKQPRNKGENKVMTYKIYNNMHPNHSKVIYMYIYVCMCVYD